MSYWTNLAPQWQTFTKTLTPHLNRSYSQTANTHTLSSHICFGHRAVQILLCASFYFSLTVSENPLLCHQLVVQNT